MCARAFTAIMIVSLLPLAALAEDVVVLPPTYLEVKTGASDEGVIRDIEARVTAGVEAAGHSPVRGDAAGETAGLQTVGVEVRDHDGRYEIRVVLARGEGAEARPFGNRAIMLETVQGLVQGALESAAPATTEPAEAAEPEPATATETAVPEGTEPEASTETDDDEGLPPTPFYVSAGVTAALAVSWAVVEGVGHGRARDLGDKDIAYWRETRSLQVADRVLLGLTGVGLATSVVLLVLTDFDDDDDEDGVEVTAGGTGVQIRGRF